MLVYGDRARTVEPRRALGGIADLLAASDCDRLTRALIEAGELAQGLADAEFDAIGCDDLSDNQTAAMSLCVAIARRLLGEARGEVARAALAALLDRPLPPFVRCKTPEGYAFYAVYPDAYALAASEQGWPGRPMVIGLRSIGTSLAAMVAAATGGEALTVRPTGPPFERRLRVSERLTARLMAHSGPFAIVDEGPGLSGSSFGCVADVLRSMGIAADRVVFMPSHRGGPGPEASVRHRAMWAGAGRAVRTLDDLTARDPLPGWFADEVGTAVVAEDLSAGGWRRDWPEDRRPPAVVAMERRKVRFRTASGRYVARFAGLGGEGAAKFARAQRLHAAGFGPQPIALRRGFLLERWVDGPDPDIGSDRAGFLRRLAGYLAFRGAHFPAAAEAGADLPALREMAAANVTALCGPGAAGRIGALLEGLERRQPGLVRVHVDGRLHPWEWRLGPAGLCKLDGLDHSCGHDLVGAQPIAWDVAGAAVEFDLTPVETAGLALRAGADDGQVFPLMAAYAAFQGGLWSSAGRGSDDAEAERLEVRRRRYRATLHRLASAG
jgi:hypothetical protein